MTSPSTVHLHMLNLRRDMYVFKFLDKFRPYNKSKCLSCLMKPLCSFANIIPKRSILCTLFVVVEIC
jgi:hypothetical protein